MSRFFCKIRGGSSTANCGPRTTLTKAFERMRDTPPGHGWRPTRRRHVVRQQLSNTPAIIRDPGGHDDAALRLHADLVGWHVSQVTWWLEHLFLDGLSCWPVRAHQSATV